MHDLLYCGKENQRLPAYSSFISSFLFLSNFHIANNFVTLSSGTERPTKLKVDELDTHMDSGLMYHLY